VARVMMNATAVAVSYPPPSWNRIRFAAKGERAGLPAPWHHTPPEPPTARPALPAPALQQVRRADCAGRGTQKVVVAHGDRKEEGSAPLLLREASKG